MQFMPPFAPLVVLMFLGTGLVLGVTVLVIAYGLVRSNRLAVKYGLAAALAGAGIYGLLLLTASLASRERVLGPGEQKYFCEVDCHVAYSVTEVTTTKTLGAGPHQATAAGTFHVVKVKTWFDERTISRHRGNGPLTPNLRRVAVVDAQGRAYEPSPGGTGALAQAEGVGTPLTQPLRPGESYATRLVFDLPTEARSPRLLITDSDGVAHLLIGHEASPFHKKIYFGLTPQGNAAAL
jgi:hypothetical protein